MRERDKKVYLGVDVRHKHASSSQFRRGQMVRSYQDRVRSRRQRQAVFRDVYILLGPRVGRQVAVRNARCADFLAVVP